MEIYTHSRVRDVETTYFLVKDEKKERKLLAVSGNIDGFSSKAKEENGIFYFPLTAENAQVLRSRLEWLNPTPLNLHKSMGFGDRLGLATPGHVRAVRKSGFAPIYAQQSVRENERTGRTPQEVLNDAMWGVFEEGWRYPWGADADHLKTIDHVKEYCVAGYTFFTIDPGDHVDNEAQSDSNELLQEKFDNLPWSDLEDTPRELRSRYLDRKYGFQSSTLQFNELNLIRAACKYGRVLAHTNKMYRKISEIMGSRPFELEISVDETETPTLPIEHLLLACELRRMDVFWISLAPRFVGRLEKGVEYIGDLGEFESEFAIHADIARSLGPYKLSLHSGSDKFSLYPIFARLAGDLVHIKTSGTSYLEALRVMSKAAPSLFREILTLARERFNRDKATYHISADLDQILSPDLLSDHQLLGILNQFESRQLLHVTFGSVLDEFGFRIKDVLRQHEEEYYTTLEVHFDKHLGSFNEKI